MQNRILSSLDGWPGPPRGGNRVGGLLAFASLLAGIADQRPASEARRCQPPARRLFDYVRSWRGSARSELLGRIGCFESRRVGWQHGEHESKETPPPLELGQMFPGSQRKQRSLAACHWIGTSLARAIISLFFFRRDGACPSPSLPRQRGAMCRGDLVIIAGDGSIERAQRDCGCLAEQ